MDPLTVVVKGPASSFSLSAIKNNFEYCCKYKEDLLHLACEWYTEIEKKLLDILLDY